MLGCNGKKKLKLGKGSLVVWVLVVSLLLLHFLGGSLGRKSCFCVCVCVCVCVGGLGSNPSIF